MTGLMAAVAAAQSAPTAKEPTAMHPYRRDTRRIKITMKTIYRRRPHRPARTRPGFWGALAAVGLTFVLSGAASGAPPAKPTPTKSCPSNLKNILAADNVGAFFTVNADTATYTFSSLQPENPVNGLPGLVGYCVYTDTAPIQVKATHDAWKADQNSGNFSFVRPAGEKSNIPLDGTSTVVGTAKWAGTLPTSQTILLHISYASVCQRIYGGDASTCFVFPKPVICTAGAGKTDAAYNAIPVDVEHCGPPSLGFEAQQTNEFGDEVALDTTGGTKLLSLTVDFQSYGCGNSGHWNTGDCNTTSGQTFTVPITANIYDPSDLTTPIATVTQNPVIIPFRPSADATNCTGSDGGKWFDPVSGVCNNSLSVPITFTFPPGTTFTNGQHVVWTVAFNTTHYGYTPIGESTTCFMSGNPGCGYDSLNVGAKSFPNAPYAGTDVAVDEAFRSWAGSGNVLASETGWALNRPLGEITLGP
jgi:hypothetical protein